MDNGQEQGFWNTKRTGELDAKLDPKLTAQRQAFGAGQGGRKLTYLEGHAAIAQLNRLFGYGGWSYSVDEMGVDEYTQGPQEQWYAGFWAVVTLRVGGVSRQDVGCVEVQNTGKGGSVRDNVHNVDSRSTARKGAVTDALKRAARTFGQQLGNGLYDTDDDVYAWMAAHSLDAEDASAPASATGSAAPPAKAPATTRSPTLKVTETVAPPAQQPVSDVVAALRAEVASLLGADTEGAGKLPKGVDAMTDEELVKTRVWLMNRAAQARATVQQAAAHAAEDADEPAPAPNAERQTPSAEEEWPRSAADWSRAQLRQRIQEGAGHELVAGKDWKALAAVHGQPDVASAAEMTQGWLLGLYQAMRAAEYQEMIATCVTEEQVKALVCEALGERDHRKITAQQYSDISQAGEARKAELSAPLLSGTAERAQVAS